MNGTFLLSTVLLDPPTAMLFGCAVALVSARLILKDPEREIGRTAILGASWGVFYALCVGWFFFKEPDWMLVYLKDARDVSLVPAFIVFALLCATFGAVGALANAALLRRGQRGLAWLVTIGAILTLGSLFWLQWRQYFLLGTYEAYYANRAVPLQSDPTMQLAMNVSGALSGIGAVAVFVMRFVQSRKAVTSAPPSATDAT